MTSLSSIHTSSDFSSSFEAVPRTKSEIKPGISNQLFFTTNEEKSEETLSKLEREPITGNTIITVSGLFGLNILATRMYAAQKSSKKITTFIVIDKSSVVKNFWKNIASIIRGNLDEEAPSRCEVVLTILELIYRQKELYFPPYPSSPFSTSDSFLIHEARNFIYEIKNGSSFASTQNRFNMIQSIFRNNRFQFLDIDITESDSFYPLGEVLTTNSLTVDTAYISNIRTVIPKFRIERFYKSISVISHQNTLIVDSTITTITSIGTVGLSQRLYKSWELGILRFSDEKWLDRISSLKKGLIH